MRDQADLLCIHQHAIVGGIANAMHCFPLLRVSPRVRDVHEFDVRTQNCRRGGDDREVFIFAPMNDRSRVSQWYRRRAVAFRDCRCMLDSEVAVFANEETQIGRCRGYEDMSGFYIVPL